jgi:tRNA(Met) cytidine acetyltransferase
MTDNQYSQWVTHLRSTAQAQQHRVALVLSGEPAWNQAKAKHTVDIIASESVVWMSESIKDALSPKKVRTLLGSELDAIVFDAQTQFDADAFAAISGTLHAGGIFILLIPDVKQWPQLQQSRFLQRSLSFFKNHPAVYFLQRGKSLPEIRNPQSAVSQKEKCDAPFRTVEQQRVVQAIEKNALQERPVPIVITSDRGRGKSTALGLAAGYLLQQDIKNILVTAPRLTTSDAVFRHARQVLPGAKISKSELSYQASQLKFVAPDSLLDEQPEADLLLVDEAAAIPLPMLEQLLNYYPHIVFASTIHGYEGTGRGFALKFNKVLDAFNPGWQLLTMTTPVRWAEQDPVEQWVDGILCLDADLARVPEREQIELQQCTVNLLDRDELIKNEEKLSSLFALLVYAHYRTQPSDLKHMLDDPYVRVYTLEHQQQIVAALLINQEGGFADSLASEIYKGQRRPPGHLLAQTLTLHAGCEWAATLRYARIMRIAVHPELQGNGLGSHLLKDAVKQEQQQGIDAIGSSFGSTMALLRFWQGAGFELVRMGFSRDHASASHSAVMLKPFSEKGQQVFQETRTRFQRNLSDWLAGPLSDLPEEMRIYLQSEQQTVGPELTEADWQDISSFISTHRGYEACMGAVRRLVEANVDALPALNTTERQLVRARVQQRLEWAETVKSSSVSGKAEALQLLRVAIGKIVEKLN